MWRAIVYRPHLHQKQRVRTKVGALLLALLLALRIAGASATNSALCEGLIVRPSTPCSPRRRKNHTVEKINLG